MEQLAITFPKPRRKRREVFASDHERGVYFWCHSDESRVYNFSSHPHELLPHYCAEHEWYSDVPCRAEHPCLQMAKRREARAA